METNRHFLPVDDNNLCVRAAKLMQEEFDLSGGLHIRLSSGFRWRPVWPEEVPTPRRCSLD